jgi:hypothetical protein
MAQSNVYSLNVVGYVNVPILAGFQILVNPLDDGAGNNLTNIIGHGDITGSSLPDGTDLYPWNLANGKYGSIQEYVGTYGWYDPNGPASGAITNVIAPGSGFFLLSPSATNITFVGSVLQGTTTNKLGAGFTLTGSTFPVSEPVGAAGDGLTNTMELPVSDGDDLYLFTPGTGVGHGYNVTQYVGGYGWYDPNNGSLSTNGYAPGVAQGFFTLKAAGASWVQTFNVH